MANQLDDEGAVIGYKPYLEYNKRYSANSNNIDDDASDDTDASNSDYEDENEYSDTLANFENNLPSEAISNLDFAIESMKTIIDSLSQSFNKGNWNDYNDISSLVNAVNNNNTQYIDEFIDAHKNHISRSIIPELIGGVYNSKTRLERLQKILKELYYGDENLSTDKAEEFDNAHLHQLQTYEKSDKSKINYLSIMYDARVNRSVSLYAFGANDKAITLSEVVDNDTTEIYDRSRSATIKKLFDEVNDEISYRENVYDNQQNIDIMEKTLYNYYNKRQELLTLYDLFNENSESIFTGDKIVKAQEEMDNIIKNLNASFIGHQYHLKEITDLESEKYHLMNIYAGFGGDTQQ